MEIFSTIDLVNQCLIDDEKIEAYKKAILENVDENTVVLEVGTGSGILSLIAAKAGAKKVYALDIDPYVIKLARGTVSDNNYNKVVELIRCDATKFKNKLLPQIDLIIAETLTTGMIDEQQAQILNNLHSQKIINSKTKILPYRLDTTVQLVCVDFKLYDFVFPIVKHLWKQYPNNPHFIKISDKVLLSSYDFTQPIKENVSKKIQFETKKGGIVNGILIESVAWLTEKIKCTNTVAFLAPVIFPVTPKKVLNNQKINLEISFILGKGYQNLRVK